MSDPIKQAPVVPAMPVLVGEPLSLQELTGLLIQHYGKTEGKFEVQLEFQIGGGSFGPDLAKQVPSVIVGVAKVALVESKGDGPLVIDAALIAANSKTVSKPAKKAPK